MNLPFSPHHRAAFRRTRFTAKITLAVGCAAVVVALASCQNPVAATSSSTKSSSSTSSSTSSIPTMSAFSFLYPTTNATISNSNGTITATVPWSNQITSLVASFSVPSGATVTINGVTQVSGTTANNFSSPVTYVVTGSNGVRNAYLVKVSQAAFQWNTHSLPSSLASSQFTGGASSSDGSHLATVGNANGGSYYNTVGVSTDSGAQWTTATPATTGNFGSIAMSSNGETLILGSDTIVGNTSNVYLSTDGGSTWSPVSALPSGVWSVASSSDGSHLAVAAYNGYIWTSTDGGKTWSDHAGSSGTHSWMSIASSSDGSDLVAGATSLYLSTDGGSTWSQITPSSANPGWRQVAIFATGRVIAALNVNVSIYTLWISNDYGKTWTQETTPTSYWLGTIAMSQYGQHILAVSTTSSATTSVPVTSN